MWNAYYRHTVERVKGVAGPLPTHHPFYVLLEASGSDPERIHDDLEKLLETAMGDNMILDATLSTSNASAAAIWRIRNSSVELGRSFPYAARIGFDVSLAIDRMEEYADTIDAHVRAIDPHAFAVVMAMSVTAICISACITSTRPRSTMSSKSSSTTSRANSAARSRPNTASAS